MGLFNKLFGGSTEPIEEKTLPWIALISVSQLEEIEERSKTKTQVVFKHSTTCGISRMAMRQFEADFDLDVNLDLYYLDLLNFRDVSNKIETKFQVRHESPQILVIKNGVVVKHASHGGINDLALESFV